MSVAIGCDDAAVELKETIKRHLIAEGHEVEDYGVNDQTPVLYPDIAVAVALKVADGTHQRAVLICGTGIGMAISANKVPGVRVAQAHDVYSARRARMSNDAQILCLGARVLGPELAKTIVSAWMASEFQGGRSQPKVDRIKEYEREFRAGA